MAFENPYIRDVRGLCTDVADIIYANIAGLVNFVNIASAVCNSSIILTTVCVSVIATNLKATRCL